MRTTVALDNDLVRAAQEFTGVSEKTALLSSSGRALADWRPSQARYRDWRTFRAVGWAEVE
jgi:Arc/MetJ family transcription regulator